VTTAITFSTSKNRTISIGKPLTGALFSNSTTTFSAKNPLVGLAGFQTASSMVSVGWITADLGCMQDTANQNDVTNNTDPSFFWGYFKNRSKLFYVVLSCLLAGVLIVFIMIIIGVYYCATSDNKVKSTTEPTTNMPKQNSARSLNHKGQND
jgi:hypothetical protein